MQTIQQESSISDKQQRFTAFLIDKLKPKDTEEFEQIIQSYTEKELKELYKQFQTMEGSLFAKMGAKLDYLTRLNGNCPEGYEIEKFSIGGCAKCKKKHALLFEPGGDIKKRFSQQKINPADTVHVNGQPRTLTDDRGRSIVKGIKPYSKEEYQKDLKDSKKGKKDAKNRVQKQDEKTMYKCGGKPKKRISKKENGSAFKKVNGGPGSVDSTRDMKPNKKQRKMIKKHQDGTNRGGIRTAPLAEVRYKNGVKDSSFTLTGASALSGDVFLKTTRRVSTPDRAKIQREILHRYPESTSDTIYTEIPEHENRIFLPNVNILPRKGFSFAKTPDYNVLERRFNTAWNLAK